MRQLDLFRLIKEKLAEKGIAQVISYETAEQSYPYVQVDIQNWTVDHPIKPSIARADIKLRIMSRYKGAKEISQLSETIVKALESTSQIVLVEQSALLDKDDLTRQLSLSFKAIMRGI